VDAPLQGAIFIHLTGWVWQNARLARRSLRHISCWLYAIKLRHDCPVSVCLISGLFFGLVVTFKGENYVEVSI
jgi:hypothetical protein